VSRVLSSYGLNEVEELVKSVSELLPSYLEVLEVAFEAAKNIQVPEERSEVLLKIIELSPERKDFEDAHRLSLEEIRAKEECADLELKVWKEFLVDSDSRSADVNPGSSANSGLEILEELLKSEEGILEPEENDLLKQKAVIEIFEPSEDFSDALEKLFSLLSLTSQLPESEVQSMTEQVMDNLWKHKEQIRTSKPYDKVFIWLLSLIQEAVLLLPDWISTSDILLWQALQLSELVRRENSQSTKIEDLLQLFIALLLSHPEESHAVFIGKAIQASQLLSPKLKAKVLIVIASHLKRLNNSCQTRLEILHEARNLALSIRNPLVQSQALLIPFLGINLLQWHCPESLELEFRKLGLVQLAIKALKEAFLEAESPKENLSLEDCFDPNYDEREEKCKFESIQLACVFASELNSSIELHSTSIGSSETIDDLELLIKKAREISDKLEIPYIKSRALSRISSCLKNVKEQEEMFSRALHLAEGVEDSSEKAYAYADLGFYSLKAATRIKYLEEALQVAKTILNPQDKRGFFNYYSDNLSVSDVKLAQQVLSIALVLDEGLDKSLDILVILAKKFTEGFISWFPGDRYSLALKIVQDLPCDADKTKFLSIFMPRLYSGQTLAVLELIKGEIKDDRFRAEALSNLIPYLPEDQLLKALKFITHEITNPYRLTSALEDLIPLLGSQYFGEVLDVIENFPYPQLKARVLQTIATSLATEQLESAVSGRIDKRLPTTLSSAHAALSEYVANRPSLITRVLNLAQKLEECQCSNFSYERAASDVFSQLAPVLHYLNETEQQKLLQSAQQLEDPGYRAKVLIALAPFYPDFVKQYLSSSEKDNSEKDDYRNLLNLKLQLALPDDLNPQTLDSMLDAIDGKYRKAEALAEVASCPSVKGYQTYQTDALREIRKLDNPYLQAQYLQRLIPHLDEQQRFEAANVISDISDPYHRVRSRVALARKFPESEIFDVARNDALKLESKVHQIEHLSTLAIDMPELLPRVIKLAETFEDKPEPQVSDKDRPDVQDFDFAKIKRRDILFALAPHLPMRINREIKRECALGHFISHELYNRALYVLARSYRGALQGGILRNDAVQDEDLLDLQEEINALSGLLLVRDLEPPMAVGILGGWGGGKSYIMHLMQQHMTQVRSRKVESFETWNDDPNHERLSPYVGHIYQIKFDAWTFAKSNLWASLMQTIFFELNRQISLEQQLAEVLVGDVEADKLNEAKAKVLCESGAFWPVLYKSSPEDRRYYLEQVLSPEHFKKLEEINHAKQGDILWDDFLKQEYGKTQAAANQRLDEQRERQAQQYAQRQKIDERIEQINLELKKKELSRSSREGELRTAATSELTQAVDAALRISRIILIQRLGNPVFEAIKKQVDEELNNQNVDTQDIASIHASAQAITTKILEHGEIEISKDGVSQTVHLGRQAFKRWLLQNIWIVVGCGVLGLLAISVPIIFAMIDFDSIGAQIAALIVPLVPAIGLGRKILRSSQHWYGQVQEVLSEYGEQEDEFHTNCRQEADKVLARRINEDWQLKKLSGELEELTKQKNQLMQSLNELDVEAAALDQAIQDTEKALPEDVYGSLSGFVKARIDDESYDKHLGLMHQVKDDLWKLSNSLLPPANARDLKNKIDNLAKVFPRGPARVVVYIDDLDRCPPNRVVEVLEAIQLLVKTPLFIAVLAIDERYITRALEQFYKGVLLRHGSPSGTDYLEKIIQLPYRVRPIMASTLETYLRAQLIIQDNALGGAKFSELTRQEFNMLLACCKQVDLSPRSLKRLTNVYKLFKIVCRTRGTKPNLPVQKAILALLALSSRYPDLMRSIFDDIETCFEEQRHKNQADQQGRTLHLGSPLQKFFEDYKLPECDKYLERDLQKLRHDALYANILPPDLTLDDMTHKIFNLIRSFSFVGEIGEDPEDYRYIGPVVDEPIDISKT
jgi:predicted KAP-like P-loop ATPase